MTNKIIVGILVVLVLLTAAGGYYSFSLNRQVDSLGERLTSFESAQTVRVAAIGDNLSALRSQTEIGLSDLGNKVNAARTDIGALKSDLASAAGRLAGAENAVTAISSNISALDKRVTGAESGLTGLSNSLIDAVNIYQKAVKATVRITDGLSLGSGFIYDASGHVVTNYHVINRMSPIFVMMYDGKVSRASVTGFCPYSDVAVLKMDIIPSIEPLPLADSGQIHIGESVIAIGSPFFLAFRDSVAVGAISQVNLSVDIENLYITNLLQFDAAINPGNSGGPLLNSNGWVIGIVVARIDANTGDGISWAIASNKVKRVADAIIATGSFAYPWIGTGLSDITPQQVIDKALESANGAIVGSISGGSPAQKAGIQTGDIIISMDGVPMRNISDLTSYLGEFKKPGDITVIEVIRGSAKLKLTLTVGTRS